MVSIQQALQIVKDDPVKHLQPQAINRVCRSLGHRWRRRVLTPTAVIHLFIIQILHCNTAISHLRHLSPLNFTASAYCQARTRLPLRVIHRLVAWINHTLDNRCGQSRCQNWCGHRLWRVDGSSVSMPDTPELQQHFGQPGRQAQGCGFPVASILVRVHAGTGLLMDLIARPLRTHEMSGLLSWHHRLKPADVVVADRGLCSYTHLALLLKAQMHGLFRLHLRIVSFKARRPCAQQLPQAQRKGKPTSRWVRRLGFEDQVVQYFKPAKRPIWMSALQYALLPPHIEVRELRYRIRRRGFRTRQVTLVTTLLDAERYPAKVLAEQYLDRWQIEVNLRDLKITLGMDVLRCKTVDGVIKELWMFMVVYNLVRLVILQAAGCQGVEPDRISFVDALRWLSSGPPGKDLAILTVNPLRPGRVEPRVVKRRPKTYKWMNKPRKELRQKLVKPEFTA